MDSLEKFNDSIKNLKSNPIFAMSLGAKELFHSNFWAWLFEHNVAYVNVFFKDIKDPYKVTREESHRDLTIWYNEKAYVIENKLKSEYDKEQLIKYKNIKTKNDENAFVEGYLTGIDRPTFEIEGWTFKSYEEIASSFEKIAEKEDCINKTIILQYTKSINDLYRVLKTYGDYTKNQLPHWLEDVSSQLENLRIWDLCQKTQANKFVNYLKENVVPEYEKKLKEAGSDFKITCWSSFSRATSMIDIRFVKLINKIEVSAGIQIQGIQYRRTAERSCQIPNPSDKVKKDFANKVFDEFRGYGWLSEYKKGNTLFGRKSSMTKQFCKYQPDAYAFVYQYFNIDNFDFNYITEIIRQDIEKDFQIIINNKIPEVYD